jgi:pilus assembly protein CpaB
MSTNVMTRTNDDRGVRSPRPPRRVRGTALVLALLLAIGATAAVFLYLSAVKKEHRAPIANEVAVIVSKQDIPRDTSLNSLISAGAFATLQIPRDAVVNGSVTDLSQLRGKTTSAFILQGEQISTARLQGSTQTTGGLLGIPPGYEAITVQLDTQKVPGQVLQPGDHVTVYATLTNAATTSSNAQDFTVALVPDVQVLTVGNEGSSETQQTSSNSSILVTLALLPHDAQNVVFAQEQGSIWLGLLPPGQKGTTQPPANSGAILKQARGGLAK